jgi:hypothetical protein
MDLVQVKIKGTVVTSRYGTLSSGDMLRTDAAYAKHLVEECGVGAYMINAKPIKPAPAQNKSTRKRG